MFARGCFLTKLIFLLILLQPISLHAAKTDPTEADILQTELDGINLQIDFLKLKVKDNRTRINSIEKKIKKKKSEIHKLETQTNSLNEKQLNIAEQVAAIKNEAKIGKQQMTELLNRFRARLVQLHKIKQGTLLGSIFSAKNLNSFLNRFQMVKYLLENDKELMTELKEKNMKLLSGAQEQARKQNQMKNIQKELTNKREKISLQKASLQAMLKTVILEKSLFIKKEKRLASSKTELEKEIQKVEVSRTATEKSFEKELADSAPKVKATVEKKLPDSAPEAARVMKFGWPVSETDIKTFTPIGDEKTAALRIELQKECEIRATGRGKVLYKGSISGLGNLIILGHQRGFSSVYANLDELWVGLGQIVDKGEAIGKVFKERSLHFEIRFGGKKQQPISFLPPTSRPRSN